LRLLLGVWPAGLVLLASPVIAGAQSLSWSVLGSPNRGAQDNELNEVSCPTAVFCMAAGEYRNPHADHQK